MSNHATNKQQRPLTYNDAEFWKLVGGNRPADGKKVRADAILKNLSPRAQEQVMDWASKPLDRDPQTGMILGGTGGIVGAVRELGYLAEKFGRPELAVSATAVARFVEWWELQRKIEEAQQRVEATYAEQLKPEDVAKLREAAEILLMRLGIAEGDVKKITAAARMQDSRRNVTLRERKFVHQREKEVNAMCEVILKKAEELKAAEIEANQPSRTERIESLRKAYFADVDATVVILPP